MRIWDVPVHCLCREHLLGEHRELHAIWSILTYGKKGYRHHPEVKRWRGKLLALYLRHDLEVKEILRRGYKHYSTLDTNFAVGESQQAEIVDSIEKQRDILKSRGCDCVLDGLG